MALIGTCAEPIIFERGKNSRGKSEGSNVFGPDAPPRSLEQGSLAESRPNQSNLALDLRQRLLYAIKEPKEFPIAPARAVGAFSIAPDYRLFTFLDRKSGHDTDHRSSRPRKSLLSPPPPTGLVRACLVPARPQLSQIDFTIPLTGPIRSCPVPTH